MRGGKSDTRPAWSTWNLGKGAHMDDIQGLSDERDYGLVYMGTDQSPRWLGKLTARMWVLAQAPCWMKTMKRRTHGNLLSMPASMSMRWPSACNAKQRHPSSTPGNS